MEMKPGWHAKVKTGSDKGLIGVIKEDCGTYAVLLREDGNVLRKNKKHIQVIKKQRVTVK